MTRLPKAAGALLCAFSLGACNLTSGQSAAIGQIAGTVTAGTITLADITPAILDAAGVSAATKAQAQQVLAQIDNVAKLTCGLAPTATSILNIVSALNPTAAPIAVPIGDVVNIACQALTAPTAKAIRPVAAARLRGTPAPTVIRGQILVNGVLVTVTGFGDAALAAVR